MPKTRSPSSPIHLNRRRWTAEEAKHTLLALEQSGLSPGAFAAREGLCPQRLWRWRRKLGELATPMFAEVLRHDAPSRNEADDKAAALGQPFEILLPSGRVVRVPAAFDASALRRLLTVLEEERPC